jgi:hypothetical protein
VGVQAHLTNSWDCPTKPLFEKEKKILKKEKLPNNEVTVNTVKGSKSAAQPCW